MYADAIFKRNNNQIKLYKGVKKIMCDDYSELIPISPIHYGGLPGIR